MLTKFAWYIRQVSRPPNDKLSVLTWQVHERYQSIQAKCNADFYLMNSRERPHKWNERNCKIPTNLYQIDSIQYSQPTTYDLLLSHTNEQCFSDGQKIAATFDLPHIKLEHCLKSATGTNYADRYWRDFWKNCPAIWNVFVTHSQRKDWLVEDLPNSTVILHGVDDRVFLGWNPEQSGDYILNVSNDFIGRGYIMGFDILQETCNGLKMKFVGDTLKPDNTRFSEAATSLETLAAEYRAAGAYFSCTRLSSISSSMLEALVTGTPCVVYDTFSVRDYFNGDGEHCWIGNDTKVLKDRLQWCLTNKTAAFEMGQRARSRVMELFGVDRHCQEWQDLFYKVINDKLNPVY